MNFLPILAFFAACVAVIAAYSADLSVQTGFDTDTTVLLQELPSANAVVENFTVTFAVPDGVVSCNNPRVSLIYEETDFYDYSGRNEEWVAVKYGTTLLDARCVSGNQANCGSYATCLADYTLSTVGVSSIASGSSLSLTVQMGPEVSALCSPSPYALNANLTLTCTGVSSGQYTADLSVSYGADTSTTVSLEELASTTNVEEDYSVTFTAPGGMLKCDNPRVSFIYEEIDFMDYSGSNQEYIDVEYGATQIQRCTDTVDANCGVWGTCLTDYTMSTLGVDSIAPGGSLSLTVQTGPKVDALCTSYGNPYALVADLTLTCTGVATTAYTADIDTDAYDATTTTVSIQEQASTTNEVQYFGIELSVPSTSEACRNPSVSFAFQEVDYNLGNEYLNLDYDGSTLATCTGAQYVCSGYSTCLADASLGLSTINPGESTLFTLEVGSAVDNLCSSGGVSYAVLAELTLTCQATSSDYSASVYADPATDTATTVTIEEDASPSNSAQTFTVKFAVPDSAQICYEPTVTFIFEQIDYDFTISEYLKLAYEGSLLATCTGAQYGCGNFATCLSGTSFGESSLHPGDTAFFTVEVGGGVDSLCDTNRAVLANLTVTCQAHPDYYVSVTPQVGAAATTTVQVQELASATNSIEYYYIGFWVPPDADDCDNPRVSMEYLEIDFSYSSAEYLALSYDSSSLATCSSGRDGQCSSWATCLTEQSLGVSSIAAGGSATFTMEVGRLVDALCTGSGIPYAVVANVSLTCDAVSVSAHAMQGLVDYVRGATGSSGSSAGSSSMVEFLVVNATVSVVAALCILSVLFTAWYFCCGGFRRGRYRIVEDVKLDSMDE